MWLQQAGGRRAEAWLMSEQVYYSLRLVLSPSPSPYSRIPQDLFSKIITRDVKVVVFAAKNAVTHDEYFLLHYDVTVES